MKKLGIIVLVAAAMMSCGNTYTAKDAVLENQNDSLNYALGFINGYQLKMYQLANDSSKQSVDEFIAALEEGYNGKEEMLSDAAQAGRNVGTGIKSFENKGLAENSQWQLNEKMLFQGLVNALNGDTSVMKPSDAREYFQAAYRNMAVEEETTVKKAIKGQCPSKVKTVALANFTDSINYAFGMLNGEQMRMYLLANDTDGLAQKDFIENINKALKGHARNPQLVMMGKQIGSAIREQEATGLLGLEGVDTKFELIKQGFVNGLYKNENQMDSRAASDYIESAMNQIKYGEAIAAGKKFLEENKLKEGVITTESGLQYEVIKMGKGAKPTATDKVKVHYHGTLTDGTVFDSSVDRGEPITFALNQVIPGWTEGVQLMPVGSKFRFYVPQELGYGARQAGSIPPYSTLIFEVELLGIEK